MKPYLLALLAALPLFAQQAEAAPRHAFNPAQRSIEAHHLRRIAEQERRESQRPSLLLVTPSPNQVIGKVARVNHEQGFVVGWLHSRYLNISGTIITRDERLRTTAVLSVGHARHNRAASLRIQSGVPNVGDEIVVVTQAQGSAADAEVTQPAQRAPWRAVPTQPAAPAQYTQEAQPRAPSQPRTPSQPRRAAQQAAQEQPTLIPAHRMRNLSNAKPEVETRITVTVE